jgi:Uma2 family endonuclease
MSSKIDLIELDTIEYPDNNGEPLSDNSKQFELIFLLVGGLAAMYDHAPDVAVHGDLLWYPVQGNNQLSRAPDAMVIFGRPQVYRGSYKQWLEGGIAPQVAFEVMSPGNTMAEMLVKRNFYETYGVEEYYEYDPDRLELRGWLRVNNVFEPIVPMEGWVSPRLGIRFERDGNGELVVYRPDGEPFRNYVEVYELAEQVRVQVQFERQQAGAERERARLAEQKADAERERAEAERQKADAERERAEAERQKADAERERAEKLAAKLRELAIDPDNL